MKPDDAEKLPQILQIYYINTVHWIYFSTEGLSYFLCKEEGYLKRNKTKSTELNPENSSLENSLKKT